MSKSKSTTTFDELLDGIVPARRSVRVCLRGDLGARAEQLRVEWSRAVDYDAEHNEQPTAPALWDALAAVEADALASEIEFVFEAIPAPAYRALVAEHPPADDDAWRWDAETFLPALVAASATSPTMSEKQTLALVEKLSNQQWEKLWATALAVNCGDDLIPLHASAIDARQTSAPKSTTAPRGESLTQSS